MIKKNKYQGTIKIHCLLFIFLMASISLKAKEFSETSYLISTVQPSQLKNDQFWHYLQTDNQSGIEINLVEQEKQITLAQSSYSIHDIIQQLQLLLSTDPSKIIPVFINYEGDVSVLDSIIGESAIAVNLFFLPQGETWPPIEYLIQSERRILIFLTEKANHKGRMFHNTSDYVIPIQVPGNPIQPLKPNLELLMVRDFEKLPVTKPASQNIRNMVPDYINFLLETWTRYGKRPNFIFINDEYLNFNFIISQLSSFPWFNGTIKGSGKTFEKVYWRNPEVMVTGGRFSFPYRGGEELTLTPFIPGYRLTPEQIIITGEMEVPESYNIIASLLHISDGLTGSFQLNQSIKNLLEPDTEYKGENYSFVQDIERGTVLRLPENASINLKSPDNYKLRNNSFSVSCFVKFSEILEFGDNAILGNYEREYRRGLHLILRSGHPYFGLWANDYVSEEKLEPNIWYHMVWRYVIETGEQAIFLNGRKIGSSEGHPPFLGTGDIYLGSALSQGANMRGYIDELHFWNRPLGSEEIIRLSLNEPVEPGKQSTAESHFPAKSFYIIFALLLLVATFSFFIYIRRNKKPNQVKNTFLLPEKNSANQIMLFGGFRATDKDGVEISGLFTPKVKELFLFILWSTLKNETGAAIQDIDEQLWPNMPAQKVSNNRAVTLNKLRKILLRMEGLKVITQDRLLQAKMESPFFCDYEEAYKLCHTAGGMDRHQLEHFYRLVQKGQFLKGISWQWIDEMKGYTGNQVIDNLLKLALIYKSENNLTEIESLARRILEYDDLNEEAIWLNIWCLRQRNNGHQARYYFESFRSRYLEAMAEEYPMDYERFKTHFATVIQGSLTKEKFSA